MSNKNKRPRKLYKHQTDEDKINELTAQLQKLRFEKERLAKQEHELKLQQRELVSKVNTLEDTQKAVICFQKLNNRTEKELIIGEVHKLMNSDYAPLISLSAN